MDKLYAGIINEIEKLYRRKNIRAFLIIDMLIAVCAGLILSSFQYRIGIFAVNTSTLPLIILGLFTDFFLPLFIIMAASDTFSGEEGSRTMKLTVARPVTRFKIFLSKYTAVVFYVALSLFLIFLASMISQVFVPLPGNSLLKFMGSLSAYAVALYPLIIFASFAVFMSQFFKSGGSSMAACLAVYIGARLTAFIFPKASRILFTSYMSWHTYMHSFTLFFLVLSYGIIFLTCGYYIFDKKDF